MPTIGATTFVPAATGSARTPLGPMLINLFVHGQTADGHTGVHIEVVPT